MLHKERYKRVFKCSKCGDLYDRHNNEICILCGSTVQRVVARWVYEANWWQEFFGMELNGHWEELSE